MKLIFLLSTIYLVQVASASKGRFLDNGNDFDLIHVARKVCWSWSEARNQISKYSTLERLVHYFESLPAEHEFSSCAKNHLKSLKALWEVTSTGNDDVCGDEKLASIERFHHQYISKSYKSQSKIEIPKVLRVFFYQYAARISQICATMSYSFFERRLDPSQTIELPELDTLLDHSLDGLAMNQNFSSYDDLYLLWSLLDRFPKKVHTKISDYLIEGSKRMVLKTNGANDLNQFRDICRDSIKPLYSQNILPALRLIDLGYYPDENFFLEQIQNNNFVKRLYKLTQLCETILPVHVLKSNSDDNQIYLMKPVKALPSDNVAAYRIVDPVSLNGLISLPLYSLEEAIESYTRIKADVKSKEKYIDRLVQQMHDLKKMKKESFAKVKLWETKQSIGLLIEEVTERKHQAKSPSRPKRFIKFLFHKTVGVFQSIFFGLMICMFFVVEVVLSLLAIISGLLYGVMNFARTSVVIVRKRMLKAVAQDWVEYPV